MNWTVPTDMWKGETVWILGGGPSLTRTFGVPEELIQKIEKGEAPVSAISPYLKPIHNEIVIGINMAFRIGTWIDMVFFADPSFYRKPKVKEDLRAFPGMKIACTQYFNGKSFEEEGIYAIRRNKRKYGISPDPDTVCWNNNSGAAAISVAANAGASRIVLVGFDMCAVPTHSHWHNEYGKPKRPPFKTHLKGFSDIYRDAKERGLQILNLSPISAIPFFPKISLSDVLEGKEIPQLEIDMDYEKSIGSMPKYQTLKKIHEIVKPSTYLEIGIGRGNSLRCSIAKKNIAIDPSPRLRQKFPFTEVHAVKAEDFFKDNSLSQPADLAFIDGLHHIEAVLRDFINVEKNSHKNTVVVLDDVAPAHEIQAHRIKQSIKWAGDVWKIVPILKQYRPDLTLNIIDTAPTGMLVVTDLDPTNTVLEENYEQIIKEWMPKQVTKEVIERKGVRTNLAFLQKKVVVNNNKIVVGVVTPTCNPDRKIFLDFLEKRIAKQTRKPDHWLKVDFPNPNGQIDLAKRYKQGIKELFTRGCDVVLFMEDDDYYPTTYIEQMVAAWEEAGRPKLFGLKGTTYYFLQYDAFKVYVNKTHCSAFCSGVAPGVVYDKCADYVRTYDIHLWNENQGGKQLIIDNYPIGIKHGIGMTGRNYHKKPEDYRFSSVNKSFKDMVDSEAYKFYKKVKKQLL